MDESAKRLDVPAGKALVYIIRPSQRGYGSCMEVYLDGSLVGMTYGKQYLYMLIDPGKHVITSKGEDEVDCIITLQAGQICFLEQQVKTGFLAPRTGLKLLTNEEGYEKLRKCKLALAFSPCGEALRP
ncbi:MAG: DUF2846 domain-containing protein [candidate division KSB1 bacterium]|nr:DUF2846 domain-containing protein [candidate division KSB1 bacterium]